MAKILYTSFYKDKSEVRQKELELCLGMNINNPLIDKIVIMIEGHRELFPILQNEKIIAVEKPRPTFQMFFDLANSISKEDDISLIANSDIFYDESLGLLDTFNFNNTCIALSRYHYQQDGTIKLHHEKWSQDTWIFKGKIKQLKFAGFHLGIRGCDNRISYELKLAGYNVLNPALSLKSIHYHPSDLHNYGNNFVPKPYMAVDLCRI